MKKIAYLSRGFGIGGAETFLLNIFENMGNKFNATLILATPDSHKDCLENRAIKSGVKIIHTCALQGIKGYFNYLKSIYNLLKEEQFDVVHSNIGSFDGVIMLIAKLAGIKKRICHAHTTRPQSESTGIIRILKNTYFKFMQTFMIAFSTDRLACSEDAGKYFYGKNNFSVIQNGINTDKFINLSKEEKQIKLQTLLPSSHKKDITIISVGRISFEKNIFFAIDVINELSKIRNDFQFIWIGDGDLAIQAKEKVHSLNLDDVFFFAGARTDVPDFLNCSDAFLMTSIFEGLPFALIEAQFSGKHCFVSDAVTEQADIGRTTYLQLDSGPVKWADTISSKLGTPICELNKNKSEFYKIEYTISQLEDIYHS